MICLYCRDFHRVFPGQTPPPHDCFFGDPIEQLHTRAVVPEHVESWVIRVCPVCRGLFEGENSWHKGDCPNRERMWIPLEIPVVSYERPSGETRTDARERSAATSLVKST